jgi:hypothetical protein
VGLTLQVYGSWLGAGRLVLVLGFSRAIKVARFFCAEKQADGQGLVTGME